jgi:hypothetical protein
VLPRSTATLSLAFAVHTSRATQCGLHHICVSEAETSTVAAAKWLLIRFKLKQLHSCSSSKCETSWSARARRSAES